MEIHVRFGKTLAWNELPNYQSCWISLDKEAADLLGENDWLQQYEWLAATLGRFDQVFRPRIKALNPVGWITDAGDG